LTQRLQAKENSSGEEPDTDSKDNDQRSSSWRQVLQEVQPLCTAWTDISTLLTWTAHERERGARAKSESLYLSFTARLPLLAANVLQGPQTSSLTSPSHHCHRQEVDAFTPATQWDSCCHCSASSTCMLYLTLFHLCLY